MRIAEELAEAIAAFIAFAFEHLYVNEEAADEVSVSISSATAWKVILAGLSFHEIRPVSKPDGGYLNLRISSGDRVRVKLPEIAAVSEDDMQVFEEAAKGKKAGWLSTKEWDFFPLADNHGDQYDLFRNALIQVIVK